MSFVYVSIFVTFFLILLFKTQKLTLFNCIIKPALEKRYMICLEELIFGAHP